MHALAAQLEEILTERETIAGEYDRDSILDLLEEDGVTTLATFTPLELDAALEVGLSESDMDSWLESTRASQLRAFEAELA